MARWPPDAGARLKACALKLFDERGFAPVTAAEIAACAGMTERTFFRHFRSKEDVLFEDYAGVREALAAAVEQAPAADAPALMQAVADCLGDRFEGARAEIRAFARVVGAEPSLRARELLRDQDWGEAIAEGLQRRGLSPRRAARIAALVRTTFRLVLDEWVRDRSNTKLKTRFRAALAAFAADLGGPGADAVRRRR